MKRPGILLIILSTLFLSGCALNDALWGLFGRSYTGTDRPVDPNVYRQNRSGTGQLWSEENNQRRHNPFDGKGVFYSNP